VARGTSRNLPVHIPTLLAAVLTSGADRFVFVHNHPGGTPAASDLDIDLTQIISDAAATCGLYFEDHFIVTDDPAKYLSMVKAGIYKPPKYRETSAARFGAGDIIDDYVTRDA